MANNTKKSLPAPEKNSGKSSKSVQPTAPERDPYAYYDELYEKKPRKKKKTDESLPPEEYEKYDELFKSNKTKSKKRPKRKSVPIEDELLDIDLTPPSSKTLHRLMPYILGVVTVFIVACFLLARIDGAMGDLGLLLRNTFFGFFGWPAYFIPIVLVNLIVYWRRYVDLAIIRRKIIFGVSIPLLLSSLIHSLAIAILYDGYKWAEWGKSILGFKGEISNWRLGVDLHGGGFFGGLFGGFFRCLVGYVGSVIVIIAILAVAIIFYVGLTPRHFLDMLASAVNKMKEKREYKKAQAASVALDEEEEEDEVVEVKPRTRRKTKTEKKVEDPTDIGDAIPSPEEEDDDDTPAVSGIELKPAGGDFDPDAVEILGSIETEHADKEKKTKTVDPIRRVSETESFEDLGDIVDTVFTDKKGNEVEIVPAPVTNTLELTEAEVITPAPDGIVDDEPEEDAIVLPENAKKKQEYEQLSAYIFPPLTLLRESTSPGRDEINAELRANAETLLQKLESFNVKLSKIEYSRGPTLTRYELYPAPGVKANSIKNLQLDIAMALQAKIRIEAPIPGKSAVGVEVPNKSSSTVAIRELLESDQFKNAKSRLYACLGKDITGEPIFIDIGKMPHLLIAGTTGSGKSVCINSIIMSLLYKARPDEVRFIMIDPKKVEMSMYNNLPHLRVPVVTNVKKAAGTLNAAVDEMERRYELFENNFARDIDGYNRMMKAEDPDFIPLHRLVIVIDELADLMMSAPTEIETSIVRLAQKARAAGIHLIIGTQRPSVDVITGLIKANIPSRIAFAVASGIDSRTIIDTVGAEKLLGRGDMLFCPIGSQNPTRAQGTFVTDEEVVAVTNFLKENSTGAHYDEEFVSQIEKASEQIVTVNPGAKKPTGGNAGGGAASGSSEAFDELFFDALKLAVESGTVATSFLQRNINVGFGRGARIIDRMAKLGFVTQPDGTKPRQVLLTQSQLAELIARDDKRIYGLIPQDEEE